MSADSFHHLVESEIRTKGKLYDFDDFVDCVDKRGTAIQMESNEFFEYENEKGTAKDIKTPLLKDISVVQFRRASTKMYYKNRFDDDEFKEAEFMKKKSRNKFKKWTLYKSKGEPRGILDSKKEDIIKKLLPLYENQEKRTFWEQLPSNAESLDLTINLESSKRKKK